MKWFQQHTIALHDPKIVKLIKLHGATGFGVYQAINILVAERESEDFTVEHDLEAIQNLLNCTEVSKIVEYCIKIGLLTKSKGKIQNFKLSKYVGNWQKRTPKTYVAPTEGLQRDYRDPTAKKEEKEGREEKRKKEELLGRQEATSGLESSSNLLNKSVTANGNGKNHSKQIGEWQHLLEITVKAIESGELKDKRLEEAIKKQSFYREKLGLPDF